MGGAAQTSFFPPSLPRQQEELLELLKFWDSASFDTTLLSLRFNEVLTLLLQC